MTLIKSISGVYGTIGGRPGDTLNPLEIVKLTSAFARFVSGKMIVVGRDGRMSGQMVRNIVVGTLMGMGCDVIDIGYASTPTTELAVRMTGADGGIVITASHNDSQWNGLKLLNHNGEFLMPHDSKEMLALAESEDFSYANIKQLGQLTINETFNQRHIDAVLHLKLVDADVDAILKKVKERFSKDNSAHISEADGLKIDFSDRWVHLRKSNTEPVVRVYSEARSIEQADHLGNELMHYFYDMQKDLVYKRLESNNNLMSHNYIATPIL